MEIEDRPLKEKGFPASIVHRQKRRDP